MPKIPFCNKCKKISELCPGDTGPSMMKKLVDRCELYRLLDEGLDAAQKEKVYPAEDVFKQLECDLKG